MKTELYYIRISATYKIEWFLLQIDWDRFIYLLDIKFAWVNVVISSLIKSDNLSVFLNLNISETKKDIWNRERLLKYYIKLFMMQMKHQSAKIWS